MLSADQVAQFRQHGYVTVDTFFTAGESEWGENLEGAWETRVEAAG
jgi:hypothetical protein